MKEYRPLLLKDIDVRLPGLTLQRLCLHKHLPEADALEDHQHRFSQVLCYFSGSGTLRAAGREYQVFPGAIAYMPAGLVHGFRESKGRRPLSLAIDIHHPEVADFRFAHLNQSEAAGIRRGVSDLNRLIHPDSAEARLRASAAALTILDIEMRALGIFPKESHAVPAFVRKFQRLATNADGAVKSIADLAAETGYQADYLNRRFREITGLTLIQQRDSLRLDKAKRLIRQGMPMQDVASRVGIEDPNYFSRWFKRHTGVPPSHYAR
jgi:AraC-like DNA-binding protein